MNENRPLINRWYWQARIDGLPYTVQGSMPGDSENEALHKVNTQLQQDHAGKAIVMEEFHQQREATAEDWHFWLVI